MHDEEERARICGVGLDEVRKNVKAIVLADSLEIARSNAERIYNRGQWPRFYFTSGGKGGIRRKTYMDKVSGKPATNYWPFSETGHTDEAKKELLAIFGGKNILDTPKPARLIERIIQIASDKDSIILDSFAGSGTTAHAVLNMNKADGGNRKFILIEMMDYANSITAERVKRVIKGYGEDKRKIEGTGGNFSFYELGEKLLLDDGTFNSNIGEERIREYIWYTETRTEYAPRQNDDTKYYISKYNDTAYYFYYEKESVTNLDNDFLGEIKTKADHYVIYADLCSISDKKLQEYNITFKKIPRDIVKL